MGAMSIQIHPYLLARLIAVQEAFSRPGFGFRPAMATNSSVPAPNKPQGNNWKEILKDGDDDEQGGGRGTMRGHRGKNAAYAKAAMRKLTRNR